MEGQLEPNKDSGARPLDEGGSFCAEKRLGELELEVAAHVRSLERLRGRLVDTEIGRRAALMGIPPEKARHIIRLADLDGVTDEHGEPDADAIDRAIDKVLIEVPELRGARLQSGGGAFNPLAGAFTKGEAYRRQLGAASAKGDLLAVVSLKRKARRLGLSI